MEVKVVMDPKKCSTQITQCHAPSSSARGHPVPCWQRSNCPGQVSLRRRPGTTDGLLVCSIPISPQFWRSEEKMTRSKTSKVSKLANIADLNERLGQTLPSRVKSWCVPHCHQRPNMSQHSTRQPRRAEVDEKSTEKSNAPDLCRQSLKWRAPKTWRSDGMAFSLETSGFSWQQKLQMLVKWMCSPFRWFHKLTLTHSHVAPLDLSPLKHTSFCLGRNPDSITNKTDPRLEATRTHYRSLPKSQLRGAKSSVLGILGALRPLCLS